jgi:PAS domain S-box-containing protein
MSTLDLPERGLDVAEDGAPLLASERDAFVALALAAVAVLVVTFATPRLYPRHLEGVSGELGLCLATVVGLLIALVPARRSGSWLGTRLVAGGLASTVLFEGVVWVSRSLHHEPAAGELFAGATTLLLVVSLICLAVDFLEHIRRERAELISDIVLVSTLTGSAVFLILHEGSAGNTSVWAFALTALIAAGAILLVVGYGVLALWCPTAVHLSLFVSTTGLGVAAILLADGRHFGWSPGELRGAEATAALAVISLVGVLVFEPRLNAGAPRQPIAVWWIRPGLLGLSLVGACALVVSALVSREIRLSVPQSVVLAVVVFGTVGARTLLNQIAMLRSANELEAALGQRETALASLQAAAEAISTSDARHRLLLDAAVDGVVELDARGTIVRANGAFCAMVRLPLEEILGRHWTEMARRAKRGDSLATLPETGEAALTTESGMAHLEARSSRLPTTPAGTLLMIRDVTASKTAEQTIRTLFQFLQDRDEDRTRLLQRSNAAIEAERNRIARDLHDGPIQGISAASLSLEAVKLMMETGDMARALDTLKIIIEELGEEAVSLRRVMSDLRPPLLEARGLIPAVRELCERWQRDTDVELELIAEAHAEVPDDIETLGYRVVQEALSNVKKHAAAQAVAVRIETAAGTLRVEVRDDGVGFDPEETRQFLRTGRVGLASMRERAELAGGTLTIKSGRGAGTTITAMLPYEVLANVPAGSG